MSPHTPPRPSTHHAMKRLALLLPFLALAAAPARAADPVTNAVLASKDDSGKIILCGNDGSVVPFKLRIVTASKGPEWWMALWPPAFISRAIYVDDVIDETRFFLGELPVFPSRLSSLRFTFLANNIPTTTIPESIDHFPKSKAIVDALFNTLNASNKTTRADEGLVVVTLERDNSGFKSGYACYMRSAAACFSGFDDWLANHTESFAPDKNAINNASEWVYQELKAREAFLAASSREMPVGTNAILSSNPATNAPAHHAESAEGAKEAGP